MLAVFGFASSASAAGTPTLSQVASALGNSPVYNQPGAELELSAADAASLLNQVNSAGTPIYIAVVSQAFVNANGGTAQRALIAIQSQLGLSGTYAIIGGKTFRAKSTMGDVSTIADQAFAQNKSSGAYAVLSAFVSGVAAKAAGSTGGSTSSSTGGSGFVIIGMLVAAGVVAAIAIVIGLRKNKQTQAKHLALVGAAVGDDVTDLGNQLTAIDTHDPRLGDDGEADLGHALDSYNKARDSLNVMRSATEAGSATQALEDGRFYLACVNARLEGKPLPERRPPCFFDPRHGPSIKDATWTPPGGTPREVPVCGACATTLADGQEPAGRQVINSAGQAVPYWQGGPAYASYGQGYYNSFSGVLPWMFMGAMFSQPNNVVVNNNGGGGWGGGDGWGGGGGGGDFGGGGGWGGGDFGGGGGGGSF